MDNNTSSKSNLNTIQNKISNKTKEQLLNEIGRLKNKIADLKIDITKCKQVEKELMESNEKFRMLSDQPLMGLIILQDELFDYVNIRASEIMEVPVKEIKKWNPKDYAKLIHSEDRDFVMEQGRKKQTGEKGAVIQYEWRMVTPNGNLKWIEMWSKTITYKNRNADMVMMMDITGRKQAEDAINESKTLLQTLVDTIPDMVWLKDRSGIYIFCNHKFEQFFGAQASEICGKTDFHFVEKDLAEFFRQKDKEAMEAKKPTMNEEEVVFASDGHHEILETIKTPIYDSEKNLIGILGIARDITERKQAEEEIKKHRNNLEKIVKKRTYELEVANKKLDDSLKVFVGREQTIIKLQQQIKELKRK